ncbi:MAG: RidA family protein [Synergistetes bacterium]|nr:RidA family protein [Synergistota bacterium]
MRRRISTNLAPQAIGPYSQAIACGDFLFVSEQIAIDPSSGRLIEGDIKDQTRRVLENIKAIVEAAGGKMSDIVKTTCFLANLEDFKAFNEAYAEFFNEDPPARTTVEVSSLPKEALIGIDAIAYIREK